MAGTRSRIDPLQESLNAMRYGRTYAATTDSGASANGRYQGIEVAWEERSILLNDHGNVAALAVDHLVSVVPLPAA